MMMPMNIVGNGIINARIALASTIHTDPNVSLREMNLPASALGASDKAYALIPGSKNNRQKLEKSNVRMNVAVVNSKIKQNAAMINAMVVSFNIFTYPYLSKRYPAGMSNASCTIDAAQIKIPTIRIGITCSPKGASKV
jgi:hypothetical protein